MSFKKTYYTLGILLGIAIIPYTAHSSESCFLYQQAKESIVKEKVLFEKNMDALMQYPDVSPSYLIETGVKYMRIYFRVLDTTCQKIIPSLPKCPSISQEQLQGDYQKCLSTIQEEVREQKIIFHSFILADASAKKITFLSNKVKELNNKLRSLLDILTVVQGEFSKLYFNQGGKNGTYVGTQAPEK